MLNSNVIREDRTSFFLEAKSTGIVFIRLMAFLIVIVLCVPVILLPFITNVPASLWLFLVLADLGLAAVFFKIKPVKKATAISMAGVCIIAIMAVLGTKLYGTTSTMTTLHVGSISSISSPRIAEIQQNEKVVGVSSSASKQVLYPQADMLESFRIDLVGYNSVSDFSQ